MGHVAADLALPADSDISPISCKAPVELKDKIAKLMLSLTFPPSCQILRMKYNQRSDSKSNVGSTKGKQRSSG